MFQRALRQSFYHLDTLKVPSDPQQLRVKEPFHKEIITAEI